MAEATEHLWPDRLTKARTPQAKVPHRTPAAQSSEPWSTTRLSLPAGAGVDVGAGVGACVCVCVSVCVCLRVKAPVKGLEWVVCIQLNSICEPASTPHPSLKLQVLQQHRVGMHIASPSTRQELTHPLPRAQAKDILPSCNPTHATSHSQRHGDGCRKALIHRRKTQESASLRFNGLRAIGIRTCLTLKKFNPVVSFLGGSQKGWLLFASLSNHPKRAPSSKNAPNNDTSTRVD